MKVYLRALELDDYILINKWRNDPDLSKYLGGNFFFVSSERVYRFSLVRSNRVKILRPITLITTIIIRAIIKLLMCLTLIFRLFFFISISVYHFLRANDSFVRNKNTVITLTK